MAILTSLLPVAVGVFSVLHQLQGGHVQGVAHPFRPRKQHHSPKRAQTQVWPELRSHVGANRLICMTAGTEVGGNNKNLGKLSSASRTTDWAGPLM
ncbi:hypothetical protein CDAR_615491 [Caerostris darwini]|uniref:Secreted protein n=1 Tax=Caerostris darwini TaxID=1538125 RepID=A0AAV4RWT8_9ARAC|nr:hypothetical protein CDAR_615491 [Caerostris darwini]